MTKHTTPATTQEESPQRIADYHGGSDNSIKGVIDIIKKDKGKEGIALSGIEEKDLNKDRDKNRPTIKEPEPEKKKEIEDPPQPKTER